jgi:hypothetical protein
MHASRHSPRLLALTLATVLSASLIAALPAHAAPGDATVTGRVIDQDGNGLAGARVSVQIDDDDPETHGLPPATTNADGTYSVPDVPPGRYHVSASKLSDGPNDGLRENYTYLYYPQKETVEEAEKLTLAASETRADIDFQLTKRGRIGFQVLGSDGQPSNFVSLAVRQSKDGGQTWEERYEGQNTTQSQGFVQITPEPGYQYKFHFYPPNQQWAEEVLHETYDPVADEWWQDATSEATATVLSTSAEGQYLFHTVQLDRLATPAPAPALGAIRAHSVKIAGKTKVGRTLSARTSAWSPKPVRLAYTWYRNGKKIGGQTKRTYKLRSADKGKRITVRVTGTKPGYATSSKLSPRTATIKKR